MTFCFPCAFAGMRAVMAVLRAAGEFADHWLATQLPALLDCCAACLLSRTWLAL